MEAKKKADEERMAKLNEAAEKQRKREAEIEERMQQQAPPTFNSGPPAGGGWRAREAAKQDQWRKKDSRYVDHAYIGQDDTSKIGRASCRERV